MLKREVLPQEETLTDTHEINGPSSNDNMESNIDFKGVLKNTTHEEKTSLTPRNPLKLKHIEEVNIRIDKTSEAYKQFKSLDRYRKFNPETKRMDCKLCEKTYGKEYQKDIRLHIDSVHMEKFLACRFCRKEFFSVVSFMHHYKNHLRKEKFRCEECGVNPGTKFGLSTHIAAVHLNLHEKKLKCNLCDKSYLSKAGLYAHNQSKHEVNKKKLQGLVWHFFTN